MCFGGDSPDLSGAMGMEMNLYNEAKGFMMPWVNAGQAAVGQWAGLLGLPGYKAIDPTAMLEKTPGYQFLRDQGVSALDRSAAARGMTLSGAQAKGLTAFGQNLGLTNAWGPYMQSLTGLSSSGQSGAGAVGGWAMDAGRTMSQLAAQEEMMKSQSQNSMWNDIMGGLGLVGGLAMAPFTGGGSLAGVGMSGLGKLFGGSGGGQSFNVGGFGSGGYGNFGGGLDYGGMFGATYLADGGPAYSDRPYIVGERGPELFVPETSGFVVPNHLTGYTAFEPWR